MNAEILSVGTELLMGQISNTNAQFISQKLSELGIKVYYHSVVGDNKERLIKALNISLERSDIIITTGGLGPTQDDLTKETISNALNLKMELNDEAYNKIKNIFKKLNLPMSKSNIKQAYIPKDSTILFNDHGTAPGFIQSYKEKIIIVLPGPPTELQPMFINKVFPFLINKRDLFIESIYIKVFGIGESKLEEKLINLVNEQTNPTIATYSGMNSDVLVRVTGSGNTQEEAKDKALLYKDKIKILLGKNIYSYENESMDEVVGKLLIKNNKTISFSESCTAGLLSALLGNISGISKVFKNSMITYSNEAKMKMLNVKKETLDKYGAVSKETAIEMANGTLEYSKTDLALSITGIAGPEGGTDTKPVGLVYMALSTENTATSFKFQFFGNRQKIREQAAVNALDIIRRYLDK
jgi:nicotinamide-nucleotide amidase